uniref:Aromatic amino acid beta-eliminating lyase/threonine aldolase domain-containing protein n=1 Tax=Percolomonas cosmopolitus TaxID=63605 RepID=A0A7S1KSU3_9EUKA
MFHTISSRVSSPQLRLSLTKSLIPCALSIPLSRCCSMNPSRYFHTCFSSDNYSGVHPAVLQKLHQKNQEIPFAPAYSDHKQEVERSLRQRVFDNEGLDVWMVGIGTAANVLGIRTCLRSNYESVICASQSHIRVHELNCMELFSGAQVIEVPVDTETGGKIQIEQVRKILVPERDCHSTRPRVLSLTSPTEFGSVYTMHELKAFSELCKQYDMFLHLDGARFANAVAAMGGINAAVEIGKYIDVLSFGGTKNGMMGAEAVVFMNHPHRTPFHLDEFERIRKQGLQLFSKTRFLTYQFEALLEDDLWLKLGEKSNRYAKEIASAITELNSPLVSLHTPLETNQIFARVRRDLVTALNEEFKFYTWEELDDGYNIIRLVTSSEIPQDVVNVFIEKLQSLVKTLSTQKQ